MKNGALLLAGIIVGALSWVICPLVSGQFEPFDTGIGFILGQLLMSLFTVVVGWYASTRNLLVSILGIYFGQNIYAYIFGTSEAKAWAILLLFTSITLCIFPIIAGFSARGINSFVQKHKPSI